MVPVPFVRIRVEMQTATAKTLLTQVDNPQLEAMASLDAIISYDVKELGQHTLNCTVTYGQPDGPDSTIQQSSFSKAYKFPVASCLSVKTKVHVPPQPLTHLLPPPESESVFLEVHIQNLAQDAIWLERLRFEAVPDLQVIDMNTIEDSKKPSAVGLTPMIQPLDVRQYVYCIHPQTQWASTLPGTIVPLGR